MESEFSHLEEEPFRANRFDLVSRLADDLAHEIKNPLNAVIINLEVLKVRIGSGDLQAALGRVGVIEEETRRLHQMVDRLLQLLRPARDDTPAMDLEEALDGVLPLFAAQARLARNEFTSDCAITASLAVRPDTFRFALLNLLTAVHDGLGEGGGALSLRCSVDGATARLDVEAVRTDGTPATGAHDTGFDRALATAGALLAGSGVRIEPLPTGVALVMPCTDSG